MKLWIVLSSLMLSIVTAAQAQDYSYEIQSLYQRLDANYKSNRSFSVQHINDYRDGRPSSYLDHYKATETNNATPLTYDELGRVPTFQMLSYSVFRAAYLSLKKHESKIANPDIMTVINFDQPVWQRRLYVLDLRSARVLFNTYVAHGYGSDPQGTGYVQSFGNTMGTKKTSLGAYVTHGSMGNRGRHAAFFNWLEVKGLDASNSIAYDRGILFHENVALSEPNMARPAKQRSYIPTEGCFGLSHEESGRFYGMSDEPLSVLIMRTIQDGTFVYAFSARR